MTAARHWMIQAIALLAFCATWPSVVVEGAPTANLTITVTVQGLSVAITSNSAWAIGAVTPGTVVTQTGAERAVVQNNGNVSERFTLQVSNTGGTWTASADQTAGTDEFVMNGIFAATGDTIVGANFNESTGNEDLITTGVTAAGASAYASTVGTANGASVPAGASRGLWLQFKAPTSSTTTAQHSISTTVGVEAL